MWYIAKYFQNSANLPQILPKYDIWLFSLKDNNSLAYGCEVD